MRDGSPAGCRRACRLVGAGLLAGRLLLPGAVPAAEPDPRGRGVLQIGGGLGSEGAPALVLGGGLGLFDTGRTRLDLLGRIGMARAESASGADAGGFVHAGRLGATSFMLELAIAKRRGRAELWAGGGCAWSSAHYTCDERCLGSADAGGGSDGGSDARMEIGSTVREPTGTLGVRVALSSRVLLELEGRYQRVGTSFVGDGLAGRVGGYSVLLGLVYRGAAPAPGYSH